MFTLLFSHLYKPPPQVDGSSINCAMTAYLTPDVLSTSPLVTFTIAPVMPAARSEARKQQLNQAHL